VPARATTSASALISGVSHVGLTVVDVEAQASFYRSLLGCDPEVRAVYDQPYTAAQVGYEGARLDIAIFRLPGSEVRLELIQYLHPVGRRVDVETMNPGTGHLCLTTDDLEATIARAIALGATARSAGPVAITAGPNAGRRVCYLRDPEGWTIELLELRRDQEPAGR
jgi:catechol 2,3-dioxygenase-like lactoylglutathione lyase family enzyme